MIINQVSLLNTLVSDSSSLRDQLATTQEQIASGLVSTSYAGLGNRARTALNLSPQVAHQSTWSANIDAAKGRLAVTQGALTGISDIASKFYAQVNSLDSADPTSVEQIRASAQSALQQVAFFLNSKSGDAYVFSGEDTSNAPLTTTDPTALKTDLLASDTATPPFSATLGTKPPRFEVGNGEWSSVGLLANKNLYATSASPTTGSYMRDIMRSLASLTTLATGSGAAAIVGDARSRLSSAISAISTEAGSIGTIQNSLGQKQTNLSAFSTTLQAQISSVQDVDAAAAITRASTLQVQLQASYQIIAQTKSLSLASFL